MKKIVIVLLLLILLCGCEKKQSYLYTESYQRIIVPMGSEYILQGNVYEASINGRVYEFQNTITEDERNAFIDAEEKICALLEENNISTDGYRLVILKDGENFSSSAEKTAIFSQKSLRNWEQIITTLQAAMGDYTNYGYLYALSNSIAKDFKWVEDSVKETNWQESLFQNGTLMNLMYMCFDEKYSSNRILQHAK